MGVLGNLRHERFCQDLHRRLWEGEPQKAARAAAYGAAGFATGPEHVADNARRLANSKACRARLKELAEHSAQLAGIDAGWAQVHLKKMVESNLADYLTVAGGMRMFDLTHVPNDKMALLTELHQEEHTEVDAETEDGTRIRKVKLKLPDKIAALALLAKIAGWFAPEEQKHSGTVTLEQAVAESYLPRPAPPDKAPAGA